MPKDTTPNQQTVRERRERRRARKAAQSGHKSYEQGWRAVEAYRAQDGEWVPQPQITHVKIIGVDTGPASFSRTGTLIVKDAGIYEITYGAAMDSVAPILGGDVYDVEAGR